MIDDLKAFKTRLTLIPQWRLTLYAVFVVFCLIYVGWSIWGPREVEHSAGFNPTKPAISSPKVPGPVVTVPIKIIPKKKVAAKYPEAPIEDGEEWVDTVDVPPTQNGATILSKIDTQTGEVTSQIEMKPAPWFAFERTNTLGAGYEVGTQGAKVPVYYRRAILRVKDVHVVGEVGAKIALDPTEKSEAHAAALVEWRF